MDRSVTRQLPLHHPTGRAVHDNRHLQALIAQPHTHLADAAEFRELAECQVESFAYPFIGIDLQPVVGTAHIADRNTRVEVAAGGLEAQCFLRALTQDRQFQLAECPFHAKEQTVIDELRIVHAVLIDDQAAHQSAELQKRVPIPAIAGEARSLDRQHGAGGAGTDCRQQALKPGACRAASRAPEVIIDDDHIFPAKHACAIGERILTTTTLRVVRKLIGGRLSHVDVGATRQMIRRDLIHRPPPSLLRARRCIR